MPDTGQKADMGGEDGSKLEPVGQDYDGELIPIEQLSVRKANAIVTTGPSRNCHCPRCKAYLGTITPTGKGILVGNVEIANRVMLICGQCRHGVLFRPSKK
jgi:hypothetical protein